MDPPSQILTKLVHKNAVKPKKVYPTPIIFTTLIYPPPEILVKTSLALPLNFQTLCIYEPKPNLGPISLFDVKELDIQAFPKRKIIKFR